MGVLMIRAGEHDCDPPVTQIVLESEVEGLKRLGWARVGIDPAEPPREPLNAPRWKDVGTTGD